MDTRWHKVRWGAGNVRQRTSVANWKQPLLWEREHKVFMQEHGRRRRVFCASLADVFDNEAPAEWRSDLFSMIRVTPNLDWLILTKRIGNVKRTTPLQGLPENVWLGSTVVNQEEYDRDVSKLIEVTASIKFLSVEPMLGPIFLLPQSGCFIDWVIVGGESGNAARPIKREWIDSLKDQCALSGIPFFFKQWGGASATAGGCFLDGSEVKQWPVIQGNKFKL